MKHSWIIGLLTICGNQSAYAACNWGFDSSCYENNSFHAALHSSGGTSGNVHLPPSDPPKQKLKPPPIVAKLPITPDPNNGFDDTTVNDDAEDLAQVHAICDASANLEACGGRGTVAFQEILEQGGHPFN